MNFSIPQFLFTSKGSIPDPQWFIIFTLACSALLFLTSFFGKRVIDRDKHKALFKTFKKSTFLLNTFAVVYLILLWFRLEAIRFFSMRLFWLITDILYTWFIISKVLYYADLKNRIKRGQKERSVMS